MHIYPQDDAKSDMLEAELWPTLPDSYTSIRKITIYIKSTDFFFLFGKKFRAGDGRLADWPGSWRGWLGWQAGWSWQADLDVGPDLKLDGPASPGSSNSPL